jgi:hypothetical protein
MANLKGQKKPHRSLSVWIADTWALEIAALILAIVSLVVIIILLVVYDGKPQFSFGFVNLNAVIAILAAAFRIGFMVPVGEALAQWKWLWFSKKTRPLGDFDAIDDASRGSRGAFLLLWKHKGWSLTAIGAWIAILSLATETFIQQLVTFRDQVMFEDNVRVSIPFAQRWSGGTEVRSSLGYSSSNPTGDQIITRVSKYFSVRDIQLDQSAQAAVQFGLNSDAAAVGAQLPFSCLSGNCTWPSYISLAVCSKCTDLTDMIESVPATDYPMGWLVPHSTTGAMGPGPQALTEYFLPNGLNINNRRAGTSQGYRAKAMVATAFTNLNPSTSLTFTDSSTLLFATTIMRINDTDYPEEGFWPANPVIEAAECGIYLCIKEFDSSVEDGVLHEQTREIASQRENRSWEIAIPDSACEGPCGVFNFTGVNTSVDALFANSTFFPRSDLSIRVPPGTASNNDLQRVNVSQDGIDSLSSYLWNFFDEGTFQNSSVAVFDPDEPCFRNDIEVTCGKLHNISGIAAGPSGNPGDPETAITFSPAIMQAIWGTPNLTQTFDNLAVSLTNEMRRNKDDTLPDVTGQVGIVRTILQVRWPWISLPAFLLAISIVFFALTIVESMRSMTPLWKGSAFPVLYHGLEAKVRSTLEHWDLPSQMEEAGEEVKVRLRRDVSDDVLLLRTGVDKTVSMPLMGVGHGRGVSEVEIDEEGRLQHAVTAPR